MRRPWPLLALLCGTLAAQAPAADLDLIIRHGRVVDGTGNPAFFADVGIAGGKIVAVGNLTNQAARELDARGMVVAPGFIDLHTHADDVARQSRAENFLRMGVTTVVVGNCGDSTLEVGKFFHDVETTQVSPNVATLIGHNSVREAAMGGSFDREPTGQELTRMRDLVDRAMEDGAQGLSTGLIYLPGTFARTEEIIELARVVARHGGLYATHMRNESDRIFDALSEAVRVGREAGLPVHVSHLKLGSERAWGQADRVLAFLEAARRSGLDVTWDQYAYTASSTTIGQLVPDSAREGGRQAFAARLADPARKAAIVEQMKRRLAARGATNYAYAVIAAYAHDPRLNGQNIMQAARRLRGSDSLDDQIETILEIQKHGSASGVFHGMNEGDLQTFMRHPITAVACDSGIREFGKGVPHPRGYGNNARVLGHYVRELGVLRLEDAIRKMTSLPANDFHFAGRGVLKPGNWADVVVFDPATVTDNDTYDDPHHYATGFAFVLVNGEVVVDHDRHTGARPGMALRHQSAP
ncbi:MAG TPA: D-aminoacylase [Verrucomicrobiae bacterium]|nr:D-aminoacylase [Verrucomicrobiae bacterium]